MQALGVGVVLARKAVAHLAHSIYEHTAGEEYMCRCGEGVWNEVGVAVTLSPNGTGSDTSS